jgi:hypothetical protein
MKLYEGPSRFDGKTIQVLVSGYERASQNRKTGPMIQSYVVLRDVNPAEAARSGEDMSVCHDCGLRPIAERLRKVTDDAHGEVCYLTLVHDVQAVWKAHQGRAVEPIESLQLSRPTPLRIASYGEATAVQDPHFWTNLIAHCGAGHTGYTQQWRRPDCQPFKHILMASVHSPEQQAAATAADWRTYRTIRHGEPLVPREIQCPAPLVQCFTCKLCDGSGRAKHIAEPWH